MPNELKDGVVAARRNLLPCMALRGVTPHCNVRRPAGGYSRPDRCREHTEGKCESRVVGARRRVHRRNPPRLTLHPATGDECRRRLTTTPYTTATGRPPGTCQQCEAAPCQISRHGSGVRHHSEPTTGPIMASGTCSWRRVLTNHSAERLRHCRGEKSWA